MDNKIQLRIIIGALVVVVLLLIVIFGVLVNKPSPVNNFSGITANGYNYKTTTASVVNCSGATSTVVVADQTGRTSFKVSVVTSTGVTLCQSATGCVVGKSGIILSVTSSPRYEQSDNYTGAYSCIGNDGSTTLGFSYSQ